MFQIKPSRCLVIGCNHEYSSRHLLQTSELLKTQRINVSALIYINASMFARIIRDPVLSTEKVRAF